MGEQSSRLGDGAAVRIIQVGRARSRAMPQLRWRDGRDRSDVRDALSISTRSSARADWPAVSRSILARRRLQLRAMAHRRGIG
jgi:hypothetical protein